MASGNTLAAFPPAAYEPPAANYATLNVRNQHPVLEFDTTTQETAIWSGVMPQHYAGGNIVVHVRWAAASATSGTIGWDATLERVDAGTLDTDADSFATAQTITAATVSGTSGVTSVTSVTCTAGATGTDSVAAGDLFRVRIRRDVANDTATGDAQLFSVELREA
jgi:hypothetical protein